jgi:hypothetical protein
MVISPTLKVLTKNPVIVGKKNISTYKSGMYIAADGYSNAPGDGLGLPAFTLGSDPTNTLFNQTQNPLGTPSTPPVSTTPSTPIPTNSLGLGLNLPAFNNTAFTDTAAQKQFQTKVAQTAKAITTPTPTPSTDKTKTPDTKPDNTKIYVMVGGAVVALVIAIALVYNHKKSK